MKVLFLADTDTQGAIERRQSVAAIQYREFLPLALALAKAPHGPLLGPVLLATIVKNAGFEVEILECAFRRPQKERLLEKLSEQPDVICITTTYMMNVEELKKRIQSVRAHSPRSRIVLGGPSVLAQPEMRTLGDYCVLGEGEEQLPPLLQALAQGKEPTNPATSTLLVADLDNIPFADWGLVDRNPGEFHLLFTQRGCLWRCAFCNYPAMEGYRMRFRSVKSIIQEITLNFEKHGIFRYMFADSTFTAPVDRCLELLEAIAKLPFRVQWAAYGRVDTITPKLRDAMVASGCVALYLGIESGDPEILRKMKKGFTVDHARTAASLLRAAEIKTTASWIIGWPGETPDSVKRTVDFATELNCDQNNINTFWLTDLSPAQLRPQAFGLSPDERGWLHATMSYSQATRWTKWAILKLISRGISIGSLFDFCWLVSLGLELDEIAELFRDVQKLLASTETLKNHFPALADPAVLREKLLSRCGDLSRRAQLHPIYSGIKPAR